VPVLTGFAPDPRQPGHWLVEVDRGRFASLPMDALTGLELAIGQSLDARTMNRLSQLADVEAAFRAGLRALARRGYAVQDLRRKLVQRQHPAVAVDEALARLLARGLLDDARFALQYAASRLVRGRGPARVSRDLQAQGIERKLAEQVVRDAVLEEGIDPLEAARAAARARAKALRELPPEVRRRRLAAFLLRRGFGGPHLADVIRDATNSA
jgi:regulatory protein